ncbi:MAG: DPP IV N-terminal domain-containing protein [Bacteroidota bacterium]
MKRFTLLTLCLIFIINILCAQEAISLDDYSRAVGFMYQNLNNKVFNSHIQPHWFPDSSGLWYTHYSSEQKRYVKISLPDLARADLFDHQKLAQILSDSLGEDVEAGDLPVDRIEYKGPEKLHIWAKGKAFILNPLTHELNTPPKEATEYLFEIHSPDSQWVACTDKYNLFIRSTHSLEIKQLSSAGEKGYEYASWYGWADIMEGEEGERPQHFQVEWSADSKWLSANICDMRTANKMYLLDWSIDSLYRPKLLSYYRGSPGDTDMVFMDPVFFNIASGKEIKPDLPRSTHINGISVEWSDTPGKVYLGQLDRGYQRMTVYGFDLNTETLDTIYSETSATNIDNFSNRFVDTHQFMFFLSEKSGWRQLYRLDLQSGEERAITRGEYYVNGFVRIDEENQQIYFLASGKEKGQNPYYQHLYRVSFDGNGLTELSPEDLHHIISLSPDGQYVVDNQSTVNIPTTTSLRSTDTGDILMTLGQADISGIPDWQPPEIFSATARDGETTIYGAMWKPTNFDSTQQYPVIEMSYTGPHTQVFPKDFRGAFSLQSYAELGFVALLVDGLGSSGRSKRFHDYSYKNLGGNLEDHVGAIRQLGQRFSWIDTSRVGIFGHSAGGYDAGHAVLAYPDFYKVAVASSADHDHRMEKAWWPEMYMGWPVDSAYHLQSNITMASNLKGKLLITHGGIDENVNPSATFKLAEALIRADKQFDMLILPSQRHGYRGQHSYYFTKVRWNYFVEHLRGVEPIWEFEWE